MFGEDVSFISRDGDNTSDDLNGQIDNEVQKILDESFERVKKLLTEKDKELRELSKQLFLHDYLNKEEMDRIISGKGLDPNVSKAVREWDSNKHSI